MLDFREVIEELNEAGYPFDPAWFAPHLEFRFPLCGAVTYRGVHLELRQALEPWHVLGEQGHAGGTVRHVDSSLDRLQLKVRGLTDSRHAVAVNGIRLPLHPTGTAGESVAGYLVSATGAAPTKIGFCADARSACTARP